VAPIIGAEEEKLSMILGNPSCLPAPVAVPVRLAVVDPGPFPAAASVVAMFIDGEAEKPSLPLPCYLMVSLSTTGIIRMTEHANHVVADVVHGCRLGAANNGSMVVAKFDLGNKTKTLMFDSATVRFLFERAPVSNGDHSRCTIPELTPEDWDGNFTPIVTGLKVTEATNGIVLLPTLNRGTSDGLLFRWDCWSFFIKNLWQYQPHLKSVYDAGGTAH
jgi:hypothetical protein